MDLLWLSGIGWDTPLRDIGWSYVFLAGLVIALVHLVVREMRRD